MNPLLIRAAVVIAFIAATVIAGCVTGREQIHDKWDADKAIRMQAALTAERDARSKERSMQQQLNEAINAAAERETKLRADYSAANAAARGLRNDIAAVRSKLSIATVEACRGTAETALVVFGECADQYQSLAQDADRLGSSAKTLNDAWPD